MIDIIGKKKIFFTISIIIIAATLLVSVVFGVRLDISFKGGTMVTYSYDGEINADEIKATIEDVIGERVTVQKAKDVVTQKNNVVVSLAMDKGLSSEQQSLMTQTVVEAYKDNNIEIIESVVVDPTIGKEFFQKSLLTIAFVSVLMVIYIAFRFRKIKGFEAGTAAVIALLHDILIVFAVFVLFRIPLNDNFIAVVLTILGYSINDTIVIYDRIRENESLYGNKHTVREIANMSMNQTFSRTINTTVTTILALVVLCVVAFIFNVDSIFTFTFPLIIGMISGVYSTICIATPIWTMWQERDIKKLNQPKSKNN